MTGQPVSKLLSLHLVVLRCQAGDERAFARLFDEFGPKTLRYLRGLVGDDAEDVQQDLWITVYRSIGGVANPGAFRTWLFRTTRHRAIDHLRRSRRERELIDDVVAVNKIPAPVATDADEPIGRLDDSVLGPALDAMPPPQREVLLLRYRDEMSYAEIALVVGCPVGTVRTRLHHAKRRLHELLHQPLERGES